MRNIQTLFASVILFVMLSVLCSHSALGATPIQGLVPGHEALYGQDFVPGQIIVDFKDEATTTAKSKIREQLGLHDAQNLGTPGLAVYQLPSDLSVLKADSTLEDYKAVSFAEPDGINHAVSITVPNDPLFTSEWYLNNTGQTGTAGSDINAGHAWNTTTGSGTTIAVIDNGAMLTHEALVNNTWHNPGETGGGKETNNIDDDVDGLVDDYQGWDFFSGDNNPAPDDGNNHGTAMAGITGAPGNDGIGTTGVSWNSQLMILRAGTSTNLPNSAITSAIYYATGHGADVVNMSLGGGSFSNAFQTAMAGNPQTLFVASAGNNSADNDNTPFYPCNYSVNNLLCVASTTATDDLSSFSNYGAVRVDVGAPGSGINGPSIGSTISYGFGSGTSQAAAVTSGVGALLAAAQPSWTGAQLKDRIMATAESDPALVGKTVTGGRVDAGTAVDFVAPTTILNNPPNNPTNDTTPSFGFHSDEDEVTFQCQIDAGSWESCSSGFTTTTLSEGAHVFAVQATDKAGNVETIPVTYVFTVDTTPASTVIDTGPDPIENNANADFTFHSDDPGAGFECQLDSGSFQLCSSPSSLSGLSEGAHTYSVRSIDSAGNTDLTPATWSWTTDALAPVTTINSEPAALSSNPAPSFTFSASEASTFECQLDSGAWITCTSPVSYTGLADGAHVFSVRAADGAGHAETSPPTYGFTIDTTAPETVITSAAAALSTNKTPSFTYSSESGASFQCRLDSAAFTACASSGFTAPNLNDGEHTFQVRAIDAVGNVDGTPATAVFTVDTIAPSVTITTGPAVSSTSTIAVFNYSINDGSAIVQCGLNGVLSACGSATQQFTGLAPGSYQFTLKATDVLGHSDSAVYSFTVLTDSHSTEPVNTIIVKHPKKSSTQTIAKFRLSGGSTYKYKIDGKRWKVSKSAVIKLRVKPGKHTFRVQAVGSAGNTDPTPAVYKFKVQV